VAILDADKEGFLRSERSLIQTIGRAARNLRGTAILYGDSITESMRKAISETERRRARQIAFNTEHGISPRGVVKAVRELIDGVYDPQSGRRDKAAEHSGSAGADVLSLSEKALAREIRQLEKQMIDHARNLEFEQAAQVRDRLARLKEQVFGSQGSGRVDPLVNGRAA
jgi:excinuclease ABC subunit B